jgi:hypothetical protein
VPSAQHEMTLQLLRDSPDVLGRILRTGFGIEVGPQLTESATAFAELTAPAYAADLVLVGDVVLVVEVQRTRDPRKRNSWPLYAASAHAAHRRSTHLVVVALDPRVARWAAKPIATFQGGCFRPIVVGPEQIPKVTALEEARQNPELAILSAMTHGRTEAGGSVGLVACIAAAEVAQEDEDRGKLYVDAVLASLSEVARDIVEAQMKAQKYEYQSEFARRYVAEGRVEGRVEGSRGRVEGRVEALATLCEVLGIGFTPARREQATALDHDGLRRLFDRITTERRWPD